MCHFGVKHFKYAPAITNNMVSIKGHPEVEKKIVTTIFVKKNLTSVT
jgi:hypothetical protein